MRVECVSAHWRCFLIFGVSRMCECVCVSALERFDLVDFAGIFFRCVVIGGALYARCMFVCKQIAYVA